MCVAAPTRSIWGGWWAACPMILRRRSEDSAYNIVTRTDMLHYPKPIWKIFRSHPKCHLSSTPHFGDAMFLFEGAAQSREVLASRSDVLSGECSATRLAWGRLYQVELLWVELGWALQQVAALSREKEAENPDNHCGSLGCFVEYFDSWSRVKLRRRFPLTRIAWKGWKWLLAWRSEVQ